MSVVEGKFLSDDFTDDTWDDSTKAIEDLVLISGGGPPLPHIRALFLSWCG
jgi:hypothetical protein